MHRTGQRFGVNYPVNVLMGKADERIQHFGHDQLSTFGIGKDQGQQEWRGIFRQLIARGLLAVDLEGHGALKLTDACRAVLRGEQRLMLRREAKKPTSAKGKSTAKTARAAHTDFTRAVDQRLWEALRARRLQLAKAQGVPPYVVFHDATLAAMVERRPQTLHELAQISGVGERKLAAYGEEFIAVISMHIAAVVEEETLPKRIESGRHTPAGWQQAVLSSRPKFRPLSVMNVLASTERVPIVRAHTASSTHHRAPPAGQ